MLSKLVGACFGVQVAVNKPTIIDETSIKFSTCILTNFLDAINWTEQQVQAWLQDNDLQELKKIFTRESITGISLLQLDNEDFRMMGIVKLGHKKKLLQRIRQLRDKMPANNWSPASFATETTMPVTLPETCCTSVASCNFDVVLSVTWSNNEPAKQQENKTDMHELFDQVQDEPETRNMFCSFVQNMTNCPMLTFLQDIDEFRAKHSSSFRFSKAKHIASTYVSSAELCSCIESAIELRREMQHVQKMVQLGVVHEDECPHDLFDTVYNLVKNDVVQTEFAMFLHSDEYVKHVKKQ